MNEDDQDHDIKLNIQFISQLYFRSALVEYLSYYIRFYHDDKKPEEYSLYSQKCEITSNTQTLPVKIILLPVQTTISAIVYKDHKK